MEITICILRHRESTPGDNEESDSKSRLPIGSRFTRMRIFASLQPGSPSKSDEITVTANKSSSGVIKSAVRQTLRLTARISNIYIIDGISHQTDSINHNQCKQLKPQEQEREPSTRLAFIREIRTSFKIFPPGSSRSEV